MEVILHTEYELKNIKIFKKCNIQNLLLGKVIILRLIFPYNKKENLSLTNLQ